MRSTALLSLAAAAHATLSSKPLVRDAIRLSRPLRDSWAFYYADTSPLTAADPEGCAFLATNIGFAITGAALSSTSQPALGALTECATAGSLLYHYAQLQLGGSPQRPLVQLAMAIDYVFALPTIVLGTLCAASLDALPPSVTLLSLAAFASLAAGWRFEKPREYMLCHGLWHVFGAAAGFELSTIL